MPQAVFVQEGDSIDYTPSSAVAAGEVVIQSKLVGVAILDIAANELGALRVEGAFDFTKTDPLVINFGDLVYWDNTADEANLTSASNTLIGKCVKAALSADTIVRVKMDQ